MSETYNIQYPKNWTHEAIQTYLTQESQQKSRERFEKTHVPIRRIRVTRNNNVPGFDEDYIDEQAFRNGVIASDLKDDNRMFFVVGESGSGKSELCQWLQYKLQDRAESDDSEFTHVPIHIPRQVREPREVLGRLADYLEDEDLDEAKQLANLPPSGVFEKTIGTITVAFEKGDAVVELVEDEQFRETIRENLEEYVDSFDDPESELEFEPISQATISDLLEKYPAVREERGQQDASASEELFDIITRQAKEAIKDMLFVGDLKETLRQINQRFQERNERPVLIIEDLTGFTIFQHEILSFFSDLGASNWDVIIGVTTGMEQKLVEGRRADIASQDTINDRISARVTLTEQTEEGSKTLFLEQEGVYIELARTYLDAIKEESDREFTPGPGLSNDELNDVFGDGLYPFNEEFLTRIYENLQEDDQRKQTPRVFLKFVLEGLLDNDKPPFQHAEILDTLGKVRCMITADYKGADRNILKWYGTEEKEEGVQRVNPQIPEVFGIESDGKGPLTVGDSNLCPECSAPMENTESGALVCRNCDTTCDDCGARMEKSDEYWICTENPSHKKPIGGKRGLYEKRLQDLLDWRGEGSEFNKTSHIEDGAEQAIRFFYKHPTSLVREECRSSNAAAFWWSKGGRKVPIHIDNGDEPDYRKVVLSRDLPESLLKDLLRLGIYDESTTEEHIQNGAVNAHQLRTWADDAVEELRTGLETDIRDEFGSDIDKTALLGKYLLNIFTGNGDEFSAKALAQPVDMNNFLRSAKPRNLDVKIGDLEDYGESLLGLFHARFHLRANMIDYERLKSHVDATSPHELCAAVGQMSSGITGFKLGPTRSDAIDLKDFLTEPTHFGIRSHARSLKEYYEDEQYREKIHGLKGTFSNLHSFYAPIDSFDEIGLSEIESAYDHLPSTHPPESITNFQGLDDDQQERYEQTLKQLGAITDKLSEVSTVWEFFSVYYDVAQVKYGKYSEYYNNLDDLLTDLDDLDSDLEREVNKLEDKIQIDIDTQPLSDCQNTANGLLEEMEGTR
ncbi:hypothetical protein [Salinibaculum rarum]|uniref:hypothetical protein n=1 Tax=Salinibaculum rarum TaxID=3058903 RepID=UPI00265F67B3|nr:hypothetical protein [Salinibaculum sp. KK48]